MNSASQLASGKLPITVVIPTKNESSRLLECLGRLTAFSTILVVDSDSQDATCEIAKNWGAEIVQFRWDGQFPKKRNWVLRNYAFTTDWVLFLDADEWIESAFIHELRSRLASENVGYWLNYDLFFMGTRLTHGVPQRKLALFRRSAGEYEFIAEDRWSKLDMEIHEHPILSGPIGQIHSRIQHVENRSLSAYYAKHNEYSDWEAHRYLALRREPMKWSKLSVRQKIKYTLLPTPIFAPLYFVTQYILMRGFLNGRAGLWFAIAKLTYFFQIASKIAELKLSVQKD